MYAIVEIAGQQFKVEKKQEIFVHRLEEKEGAKVQFADVLLIDNDGKVKVGTPKVEGAAVSAKVIEHMRGDKVLVFKKKRRKGYQKLNGHRQYFTKLVIDEILENVPKAAPKAAKEEPKAEVKEEAPKAAAEVKETTKAPAKPKAAPKATADSKPAAKKAAPKKEAKPKAAPKAKVAPKAKKADADKKEDKE